MAIPPAAIRLMRRPVAALAIAIVAFVATVLFSVPRPVDNALTAGGLPSGTPETLSPVATEAAVPATPGSSPAPSAAVVSPAPQPSPTPVATPASFADPSIEQALQRRLDKLRAKYAIPGVSATVILADGSTWTGVSGLADVRRNTAVAPDTAFAIASVSKTYTAAVVLALADEGALDLDARVSALLPDVRIGGKATVRQLLDHTSGLPDYFLHGKIDKALFGDPGRAWSTRETFRYVGKPIFPAGRGWYYSNTNYHLLGLIVETVAGRSLAEEVRARFLDPLELTHTWSQVAEAPRGPFAHGYRVTGSAAKPTFRDWSDGSDIVPFTSVVTAAGGAGSLAATSGDVARWARALYRGEALPAATVKAMVDDSRRIAKLRPKVPYGLGVQVTKLDGRPALGHSGRLAGFRSVVRYLPREGITIAVLTNEAKQDPTIIAKALLRIVSPPPPASPSPSPH
jgi:D-alanyl-D-alanine carboxypeptidase